MDIKDLLRLLPATPAERRIPLIAARQGLTFLDQSLPEFVAPPLAQHLVNESVDPPDVIIISAAGSVGKSTLARELAHATNAPYWDLAQAGPVGQGSLLGLIAGGFGPENLGSILESRRSGQWFIVIDALDEARVGVTEGAFAAFVSDIAEFAKEGTGCKAVLLGRTQIAETTWLHMVEEGATTTFLEIEPFTLEQSQRYIDLKVRAKSHQAAANLDAHLGPYKQARDGILANLQETVTGTEPSESGRRSESLGYAPVLDAAAVLLSEEPNFASLNSRLADTVNTQGGKRSVALLRKVVELILDREQQQKLIPLARTALADLANNEGWADWDRLYTRDEQIARLLNLMLGEKQGIDVDMPDSLRAEYETLVGRWFPEHAFLRDGVVANPVFESYLLARSATREDGARQDIVSYFAKPSYLPSRLFADFYFAFSDGVDGLSVPAEHLNPLYDSLMAGESDAMQVRFILEGSDPEDVLEEALFEAEGEFELISPDTGTLMTSWSFRTQLDPNSTIAFRRYLRDVSITTGCTVVVGTNSDDFEIGPAVTIRCRALQMNMNSLIVSGRSSRRTASPDDSVVLEAAECSGTVGTRPTTRIDLRVNWPGSTAFPWTDFSTARETNGVDSEDFRQAYRRFRRIVTTLRSHGRGGLARFRDKIEHRRVMQGAMGEALLEKLLSDGILFLEQDLYHWSPDRAASLVGVSYQQLRAGQSSSDLQRYLEAFIREKQSLFSAERD